MAKRKIVVEQTEITIMDSREHTGAIGIVSKSGRYGGTFAHRFKLFLAHYSYNI